MIKSGIYCIKNLINKKRYIGSAIDLKRRKREHFSKLRRGTHDNIYLQRAWDKYGSSAFTFYIVEYEANYNNLIKLEQKYIDLVYRYSLNAGYNISKIAGSSLGIKRTPKQIETQIIARGAKLFHIFTIQGEFLASFINKKNASIFIGIKASSANVLECLNWKKKTLNSKFCIYDHELHRLQERIDFCQAETSRPFIISKGSDCHIFLNQTECARKYKLRNKGINKALNGNGRYKSYLFEYL